MTTPASASAPGVQAGFAPSQSALSMAGASVMVGPIGVCHRQSEARHALAVPPWLPQFEDSLRGAGNSGHRQKHWTFLFSCSTRTSLERYHSIIFRTVQFIDPFPTPDRELLSEHCHRYTGRAAHSSDTTVLQVQLDREPWTTRIENSGGHSWTHHPFTANKPARYSKAMVSRWGQTMARLGVLMGQSSLRFQSPERSG